MHQHADMAGDLTKCVLVCIFDDCIFSVKVFEFQD